MKQSGAEFHEWPLSPLQQEIVAQARHASTRANHIQQICLTLKHELDISRFVEAWRSLAQWEPALCTQVVQAGMEGESSKETATKQVKQAIILPVETYNWEPLPLKDRETAWENLVQADQNVGFDFKHAPYMRVTLIKCGASFYYCLCSFHTLLMDEESVPLLLQKVFERYKQSLGPADDMHRSEERSQPHSADHSLVAYHSFLEKIDTAGALGYWADHLANIESPTPLGLIDSNAAQRGGRKGSRASKKLSTYLAVDTTDLLKRYIAYHGISFETLFYGVWGLLQYHYTAEELILFGTRRSAREELPALQERLGQFSDFLPLCIQIDPNRSLIRYFQAVHTTWLENKRHGFIPTTDLKIAINFPEERSLYETEVIIANNRPIEEMRTHDRNWAKRDIRFRRESSIPLSLIITEDDHLVCSLLYDPTIYTAKVIGRMLEHLNLMLTSISNHGNMSAGTLPFLSEYEAGFLTERINQPSAWDPADFPPLEQIEQVVATHPGKIALVENDLTNRAEISFVDLQTAANQIAHFLIGEGVQPGDIVAIHLGRSIRSGQAILGAMTAGAAIVWLDPEEAPARLTAIIAKTKPTVILTGPPVLDVLQHDVDRLTVIDFDAAEGQVVDQPRHTPNVEFEPHQIALLDHFVTADGQQQAVMLSHATIANLVLGISEHLSLTAQENMLSLPSERTESFVFDLLLSMGIGSTLHLITEEGSPDHQSFSVYAEKSKITFIQTTVQNWEQLLKRDQLSQNRIKKLVFNGNLSQDLTQKLLQNGGELWQAHGMRESTYWTTINRIRRSEDRMLWGSAAPNVKPLILDRNKLVVPFGGIGELYITGPGIAQGYLHRSEEESPNFVPSPLDGTAAFRTGLLFRYRGDQTLQPLASIDPAEQPAATVTTTKDDEHKPMVESDQNQQSGPTDITDNDHDFEGSLLAETLDTHQTETELNNRPVSQPELEQEKITMDVEMSHNHPNSENEEGSINPTPTAESIIANVMPDIPSPDLPADASEEAMMQLIQQQFAFQQNLMEIIAAQQKQFQDLMLPLISKIKTQERRPAPLSPHPTVADVPPTQDEPAQAEDEPIIAAEIELPEPESESVESTVEPATSVAISETVEQEPVDSKTFLSDAFAAVSKVELPATESADLSQTVEEAAVDQLSPPAAAMPEVTLDLPEIEPFNLDQHDEKREVPQTEIGIDLPDIEPFQLETETIELDQTAEPDVDAPAAAEPEIEAQIVAPPPITELPSFEELVFPTAIASAELIEEEPEAAPTVEQPTLKEVEVEVELEPEPDDMVELIFDDNVESQMEIAEAENVDHEADADIAVEEAEIRDTAEILAEEEGVETDQDPIELLSDAELESIFAEIAAEPTPPFEESSSIEIDKIDSGAFAENRVTFQNETENKAEDQVETEVEPSLFEDESTPQVEAAQQPEMDRLELIGDASTLLEESRLDVDDPAAVAGFDLQSELSSLIDAALERISEPDEIDLGDMNQFAGNLAEIEPMAAAQETDEIPETVVVEEKPAEVTFPGTVDPTLPPELAAMEAAFNAQIEQDIETEKPAEVTFPGTVDPTLPPELAAMEAAFNAQIEQDVETEKPAEVTLSGTVDPTIVPELTEDEVSAILGVVDDQPARTLYQAEDEAAEQSTEAILQELENEINQIEQLPLEEIGPPESNPMPQSEITPTSQEVATSRTWLEDDLLRWIEEASEEESPGQELAIDQDRQEDTRAANPSRAFTDETKTPQPTKREIGADDPLITGSPHETMKTTSPFQFDIPDAEPESILDQIVEEFEDDLAAELAQTATPVEVEEETVISKGAAIAEPPVEAEAEFDPLDELEALANLDMDDTVPMDPLHPLASVAQPMLPPQNRPTSDQSTDEESNEKRRSFFDRLKKKINQKKE